MLTLYLLYTCYIPTLYLLYYTLTICDSRYCFLYQLIIVTVSARMLFGTDAHVV